MSGNIFSNILEGFLMYSCGIQKPVLGELSLLTLPTTMEVNVIDFLWTANSSRILQNEKCVCQIYRKWSKAVTSKTQVNKCIYVQ